MYQDDTPSRSLSSLSSYCRYSQHHNCDPQCVLSCCSHINEVCLESRDCCHASCSSHAIFTQHLAHSIGPSVSQQAMTETHSARSLSDICTDGVKPLDPAGKMGTGCAHWGTPVTQREVPCEQAQLRNGTGSWSLYPRVSSPFLIT